MLLSNYSQAVFDINDMKDWWPGIHFFPLYLGRERTKRKQARDTQLRMVYLGSQVNLCSKELEVTQSTTTV